MPSGHQGFPCSLTSLDDLLAGIGLGDGIKLTPEGDDEGCVTSTGILNNYTITGGIITLKEIFYNYYIF